MTRVFRFGARFRRAADRLSIVHGSARGRAVAKTIEALATADTLPGPDDTRTVMPPSGDFHYVRRVQGRNLWIWYQVSGETLYVAHVSSDPPVPVDE